MKGNRNIARNAMKASQLRRYGGTPRKTWAQDKTPGNFAPRGCSTLSTKAADRQRAEQIMRFAVHL